MSESPPPGRSRRKPILMGAAAVAAIGVVAAIGYLTWPTAAAEDRKEVNVESADVVRGDLTELVRASGKLGFGDPRDLGTNLAGTITGLPGVGSVVGVGGELFRVDDRPVVLFRGELPMWRSFESGMEDGADVFQLERNLKDLGFFDREPDQEFAESTAWAIEEWQESLGLDDSGSIELGRIVFSPTDVRVAQHKIAVGSAAGAGVLGVSGTSKEIGVSVDPNLGAIATAGSEVIVVLPNGAEAKGKVAGVGTPVEQDDPTSGEKKLKLPLTITLDDLAVADGLDNVSVSVIVTRVRAEDALQVPVLALLARPGGGFAVEVVNGKQTKMVDVELGAFADGMVEVTGGDLEEGDRVVVGE
ncbi:peptidoglycan-binding protein [Agromyces sp. SYSU K20354]|uniref:peptidoglycan-binding protein n=1 Tax=Agromyces cavernae TaxID=2898659 RepID=UPI001E2CEDB5|nr:peptidoglycan-binding protein [Agromyces cavernae]MCD2442516.1 peptidoglycan-binding protein [Agromyces cavernae]